MKKPMQFITALALLCPLLSVAKINITSIKQVNDGFHLMYYDTTSEKRLITKSAIVEFKDYLVLIEMPISNNGSGTTDMKDHTEEGRVILQTLKDRFPKKPLKYVLSTHWHPHSISSVVPFLSNGVTIVTTKKNFKRISEYADAAFFDKYQKQIKFVEEDGSLLKDKTNEIIAYKLDKKDYPHIPAEDFVFYYLPRYNYLHSSCMFQRFAGSRVKGKEMISSRVDDLIKLIDSKQIDPDCYITTDTYWDINGAMASGDTMRQMRRIGIGMTALEDELLQISTETLRTQTDSLVKGLMEDRIPTSILNGAVYRLLREQDLDKALALARLQVLVNPSSANVWDTFGEVYYFMGETTLAKKYEAHSMRIDKDFKAGEAAWKQDLEDYRKLWQD